MGNKGLEHLVATIEVWKIDDFRLILEKDDTPQPPLLSLEIDDLNHVFKKCKQIDGFVDFLPLSIDPHPKFGSRLPD
ncbi:MAG: hypothetical protein EA001_05715 [Oscillatoriales cyanobacterium]|nr:MAG: hypothetical protein EA001_05715 [Oscillatoriales cyanobacterium]